MEDAQPTYAVFLGTCIREAYSGAEEAVPVGSGSAGVLITFRLAGR